MILIFIVIFIVIFTVIFGAAVIVILCNNTLYCHIYEREDVRRWEHILSIADKFEYESSEVGVGFGVDNFLSDEYEACLWHDGTVSIHYADTGEVYVVGFYRRASNKMRRVLEKQIYQQEQNGEV